MITDNQSNFLYLSDCLPKIYPTFYKRFEEVISSCRIEYKLLPNTKDIWAVDYMPIQIERNKFVQFVYNPNYLKSKTLQKTISDVDVICQQIGIKTIKSTIKLDGGNVIKGKNKAIITTRIFSENSTHKPNKLREELCNLLEVEQIIIVPEHPDDFTGHADGLIRFVDDETVLINDFSKVKHKYSRAFEGTLIKAGLKFIKIPYNPYYNKLSYDAKGIYMNYLQMKKVIIVPVFDMAEDEIVVKQFEKIFSNDKIVTVLSNEIAMQGGILNCITWNIKK